MTGRTVDEEVGIIRDCIELNTATATIALLAKSSLQSFTLQFLLNTSIAVVAGIRVSSCDI